MNIPSVLSDAQMFPDLRPGPRSGTAAALSPDGVLSRKNRRERYFLAHPYITRAMEKALELRNVSDRKSVV